MRNCLYSAAMVGILFAGVSTAAIVPTNPDSGSETHNPPKHVATPHVANPHLHGAKPAIAKPAAAAKPVKTTRVKTSQRRVTHWSFTHWAALHRGTGTIVGQVVGKTGKPVAGAQVVLRKPGGNVFKLASSKHITHTNAAGEFVMHNVRIGSYRVRAQKFKAAGHTGIHLAGGQAVVVNVKV